VAEAAIRLWLFSDQAQVVVLVWDASPRPPVRMMADGDAEDGRGLLLVEALSEQWGWHLPGEDDGALAGDQSGKFVWAIVQLPVAWGGEEPAVAIRGRGLFTASILTRSFLVTDQ
jgi:hypothetical protein